MRAMASRPPGGMGPVKSLTVPAIKTFFSCLTAKLKISIGEKSELLYAKSQTISAEARCSYFFNNFTFEARVIFRH